jgi:hypothetical protein
MFDINIIYTGVGMALSIEQHVLDTNTEKQLPEAAADVQLTLSLKK